MHPVYWFCHRLGRSLARACLDYRVIGRENLIEDGGALYCCNHVSYFDPPLAGFALDQDMHFLARHTLYSNAFARWLLKDDYPETITVYLIEGAHFTVGEALSPPVEAAMHRLGDLLLAELRDAAA